MALSAFQSIVCDFEANAIGVGEIRCPIVGSILKVELCHRSLNARAAKLGSYGYDIGH